MKYEKKNVEKETFIGGDEYLLSNLDLKLKDEDKTKWTDYKDIEVLSNLINATSTKKIIRHRPDDGGAITK